MRNSWLGPSVIDERKCEIQSHIFFLSLQLAFMNLIIKINVKTYITFLALAQRQQCQTESVKAAGKVEFRLIFQV